MNRSPYCFTPYSELRRMSPEELAEAARPRRFGWWAFCEGFLSILYLPLFPPPRAAPDFSAYMPARDKRAEFDPAGAQAEALAQHWEAVGGYLGWAMGEAMREAEQHGQEAAQEKG